MWKDVQSEGEINMHQVLECGPIHHKIWCLLPIAHILVAPPIPCLLFWFIFVVAFQNTISLCSIGCPGTCPVDQAGLGLTEILCSVQVLWGTDTLQFGWIITGTNACGRISRAHHPWLNLYIFDSPYFHFIFWVLSYYVTETKLNFSRVENVILIKMSSHKCLLRYPQESALYLNSSFPLFEYLCKKWWISMSIDNKLPSPE